MRRFFVKNLLFIIAVNLLVKPVWVFMIDRTVQNTVGHEQYGTYQALLNICLVFQILLDFGLTNYNTNLISQNRNRLRELFPAMLATRMLLILAYTAIVFIAGLLLGYHSWELGLLAGVLSIQALSSLVLYLRSNISAMQFFKTDGVLSVTDRLLMIGICGFLLYNPATASSFKIEWFVWTQIVCYALTAIAALYIIYRKAGVAPSLSFKMREVYAIIRKSFPYAILILLMSLHMRSDMILVERMASKDEAGIYATAMRLLDVSNMFGIMFAGVLLPLFGKMIADKQSVQPIIKLSVNMLLPFAMILCTLSFFWGRQIMEMLYNNAGSYDGEVFAWVMAAFPAYCIMYTYSTLLTANGSIALLNKISLAGVVASLSLNYLLVPMQGALGAAITAFATQTFLAVCYIVFCKKEAQLPKNIKWISAHISFVVLIAGIAYTLSATPLHWVAQLLLTGCAGIIGTIAFRFISIKGIQLLMQKK
ncbi:hypothetical protein CAP35_04435 [Chitinophagaceae bacterium IBVUCB1]|nr:hypothetical protein CAP35_04435 [Chitinophagaceae bacterium IBVUCB1]